MHRKYQTGTQSPRPFSDVVRNRVLDVNPQQHSSERHNIETMTAALVQRAAARLCFMVCCQYCVVVVAAVVVVVVVVVWRFLELDRDAGRS